MAAGRASRRAPDWVCQRTGGAEEAAARWKKQQGRAWTGVREVQIV